MKKENSDIFHLRYKDAIKALKSICRDLSTMYYKEYHEKIKISFIKGKTAEVKGKTADGIYGDDKKYIKINISNLRPRENKYVSAEDFFSIVECIFHENRHMENALKNYKNIIDNKNISDINEFYISLSRLLMTNNENYYDKNYLCMPHEIDAEYYGILNAYDYLIDNPYIKVSREDCEKLVVNYVNGFFKDGHKYAYYIKLPDNKEQFTSMAEIKRAFETAFEMSKHQDRHMDLNWDDEAMRFLKNYSFNQIYDDMIHDNEPQIGKGFRTDIKITSIALTIHPKLKDRFSRLDGFDLSFKNIFGEYEIDQSINNKNNVLHSKVNAKEDEFTYEEDR